MPGQAPTRAPQAGAVAVRCAGSITAFDQDCAAAMVGAVLRHHGLAPEAARVRISGRAGRPGPTVMQVNVTVGVTPARVQVPGESVGLAVAACAARLDRQIRRLISGWEPWEWPDPQRPILTGPGPARIARVKDVSLRTSLPCQAMAAMNTMDYDVHLFVDGETGEDAVVFRTASLGVRLARQQRMHPPARNLGPPMTVNPRSVPTLAPEQAAHRLAEGWLPFLFFTEPGGRRGNLIYRRYAGDVALIRPKPEADPSL